MDKSVNFFKNAIMGERVGAVSRSSKYVINEVLKNIESGQDAIVEFGPGDGVLTTELLKKLTPLGKLFAVELDPNFIKELRKIKDERLVVIEGKMENVLSDPKKYGIDKSDCVISSVPFTFIKKEDREAVVRNTRKILGEKGKFIIFHQYSLLMSKILKKYFTEVSSKFEPRNFFPCFIMVGSIKN